ncbi:MAG: response regulator [Anaerobacillus sp.]|uniref:response regulator transcription factor n=1 Tax=Anaerobacillus sp. TaxID=1872506 RepID=UPI0039188A36
MYNLLVVDDEQYVTDYLTKTVSWESVGIDKVFSALSAQEAIEIMESEPIDIIITDIRMPGMDGIELIKVINNKYPTKCIMLSGYADFNYAKEALKAKAVEYLLKPVRNSEVLEVVSKTVNMIKDEKKQQELYQSALHTLKDNSQVMRQNFFQELIEGKEYTDEMIDHKVNQLNLPLKQGDFFTTIMIRVEKETNTISGSLSLEIFATMNIVNEIMEPNFELCYFRDSFNYLVLLVKYNKNYNKSLLEKSTKEIVQILKSSIDIDISIILLQNGIFPTDVISQYQQAMLKMRRSVGQSNKTIGITSLEEFVDTTYTSALYEPPSFMYVLEEGNWDEIDRRLDSIFEELRCKDNLNHDQLMEVFFHLTNAFIYVIRKKNLQLHDVFGLKLEKLFTPLNTLVSLESWVRDIVHGVKQSIVIDQKGERVKIVQKVKGYIDSNIAEDLSLQKISDFVYLHPTYLSKIYKDETGETLSDYICRIRMGKAAHLLRHTHQKINDISKKVGYSNPSYFIKVFRKYFVLTPQEYRKK